MNKISTLSPGLAREYSAGSTYEVGQYVLWRNAYWKCSVAIPVPEEWTPGHWTLDDSPLDYKADLVDGKVPAAQLPSYVDDVVEYDAKSVADVTAVFRSDRPYPEGALVKHGSPARAYVFTQAHPAGDWTGEDVRDAELFPVPGEKSKIYLALNTDTQYRWSGSTYIEIAKYVAPYGSNPEMAGTASPGTADAYSRGDHVHPAETVVTEYSIPTDCFPISYTYNGEEFTIENNAGYYFDNAYAVDKSNDVVFAVFKVTSDYNLVFLETGADCSDLRFGYVEPTPMHWPPATETPAVLVRGVQVAKAVDVPSVVSPSTSSSTSGKAADAKATGDALAGKLSTSGGVNLRNDPLTPGWFIIESTASGHLKQLGITDDVTSGQAWELCTTGSDPDTVVKIPVGPGTLALTAGPNHTGNLAALDSQGNPTDSGMNRDGNGNLDATEFTFTPAQVADYDSAAVGTVINKSITPVVLHGGQHYVVRKSFVKTNGGWNVDSVTGRVVLPGASGTGSTALGDATQAIGSGAVSTGKNTKASGAGALSSGQETDAAGTGAHAEGQSTSATATCAHSEGYFTIAQNQSEHAQGEYNASHTGATASERTLNSIGVGDSSERKNAVEVMRDGRVFVLGLGRYVGTNPANAVDLASAVNAKADKPATFTEGNLAKFDASGNPTDADWTAGDLAWYALTSKTISSSAVALDDRACNYVDARTLGSSDSLDVDFPILVDGKARDFVLAVECGANPPTISYAAFVTIMAEDASSLAPEEGMNIYSFTEFKTNMFIAARKTVDTVVANSPESGDQLMLAMQDRGIDTTSIMDFGGVETALGLGDTGTPQDAVDAVMN